MKCISRLIKGNIAKIAVKLVSKRENSFKLAISLKHFFKTVYFKKGPTHQHARLEFCLARALSVISQIQSRFILSHAINGKVVNNPQDRNNLWQADDSRF